MTWLKCPLQLAVAGGIGKPLVPMWLPWSFCGSCDTKAHSNQGELSPRQRLLPSRLPQKLRACLKASKLVDLIMSTSREALAFGSPFSNSIWISGCGLPPMATVCPVQNRGWPKIQHDKYQHNVIFLDMTRQWQKLVETWASVLSKSAH